MVRNSSLLSASSSFTKKKGSITNRRDAKNAETSARLPEEPAENADLHVVFGILRVSSVPDHGADHSSYNRIYRLIDNPQGFESLEININKNTPSSLTFRYTDKNKASSLPENALKLYFGIEDMADGIFPVYNCAYTAGGVWLRHNVLYIRFHLIGESVGSVRFQLYFGDDDLIKWKPGTDVNPIMTEELVYSSILSVSRKGLRCATRR